MPRAKYLRREITARQGSDWWFRWLGIFRVVHWLHSTSKLVRIWPAPRFQRNGAHGLVGGRERALRYSGHGDGSAARSEREEGHAEATGGLGGAERRRVAGFISVGRHGRYCRRWTRRRRRDSSAPTPTSSQPTMRRTDKKREQCTSGQASHWRDGRRRSPVPEVEDDGEGDVAELLASCASVGSFGATRRS